MRDEQFRFANLQTAPDEISVKDEVRDMWKPAYTEPGLLPQLTMPGVQLSTDLVRR